MLLSIPSHPLIFAEKVDAVDSIYFPFLQKRLYNAYQRSPIHSHLIPYADEFDAFGILPHDLQHPLLLRQSRFKRDGPTLLAGSGYPCFPFFFPCLA